MVLLDAAKGCGTAPPDLTRFPADFVAISFYKIFGYPTGLGALLVRRDAAALLKKKYFGGGTVAMSIADADVMRKRDRVEQWLEDGTTSFLGIAAPRHGFASIDRLQIAKFKHAVTKFIVKYFVGTNTDSRTNGVNKPSSISSTMTADNSTDPAVIKQEPEYILFNNDKMNALEFNTKVKVENLVVYPIKSCGGFSVNVWPLSNSGLLYDREWMIQRSDGDVLTQKKLPLLCSIQISIDLKTDIMHVTSRNMQSKLAVSLQSNPECSVVNGVKLCGNRLEGNSYGEEVTTWFTEYLGVPCTLVRKEPKSFPLKSQRGRSVPRRSDSSTRELSFANEAQLLLVSKASVDELNRRVAAAFHAGELFFSLH